MSLEHEINDFLNRRIPNHTGILEYENDLKGDAQNKNIIQNGEKVFLVGI